MDNLMYNIFNTDLICPNCGEGHIIREEPKVIKSNTERYTYLCTDCGFVHTAKSDEDMMKWIKSLDKPLEEEILKEQVKDFIEIVDETMKEQNKWGLAMMDALGEACKKEMESWSPEEREQAKENLKKSIDRAVEIGNQKHHIKEGPDYHANQDYGKAKLSFKIETANGCYTVLTPFDWKDKDEILEYYYTHEVFSVSRFIYGSIDFIPKHAIQAIHIEGVDDEEE